MTFDRIVADWPAPSSVLAFSTCREGGFSHGPYSSFNLGLSVGDEMTSVQHNRSLLQQEFEKPLFWLHQVHGNEAVELTADLPPTKADAIYTREKNMACIVKTADCLPILLAAKDGSEVAAIHGGWRSLASGIIANTLKQLNTAPENLMAWLGPAISQAAFEVGPEVKQQFLQLDSDLAQAFKAGEGDRLYADLYLIARLRLQASHVTAVYGGDYCTYSDKERFFSYRRDKTTGRMASIICIK